MPQHQIGESIAVIIANGTDRLTIGRQPQFRQRRIAQFLPGVPCQDAKTRTAIPCRQIQISEGCPAPDHINSPGVRRPQIRPRSRQHQVINTITIHVSGRRHRLAQAIPHAGAQNQDTFGSRPVRCGEISPIQTGPPPQNIGGTPVGIKARFRYDKVFKTIAVEIPNPGHGLPQL